MSERKLEKGK